MKAMKIWKYCIFLGFLAIVFGGVIACDHGNSSDSGEAPEIPNGDIPEIPINETPAKLLRTYGESVIPVQFDPQQTKKTIIVDRPIGDSISIYLGKVNNSNESVSASKTGGADRSTSNNYPSPRYVSTAFEQIPPAELIPSRSIEANSASVRPPVIGDKTEETFIRPEGIYNVHFTKRAEGQFVKLLIGEYQTFNDTKTPAKTGFLPIIVDEKIEEVVTEIDGTFSIMADFIDGQDEYGLKEYGNPIAVHFYQSMDSWAGYYGGGAIYISSHLLLSPIDEIVAVFTHELVHYFTDRIKRDVYGKTMSPWYAEFLAEISVVAFSEILDIDTNAAYHPWRRIPAFIRRYYDSFFLTYEGVGTLGSYLMLNYDGAQLLKELITNNEVDFESITLALGKLQNGLSFNEVFSKFAEAFIFSGPEMPMGVMSFDKKYSSTVNGIEFTITGVDIWEQYGGPEIFDLNPRDMPPYSILLQSSSEWQNKSGRIALTLHKPEDPNIELYLMIR